MLAPHHTFWQAPKQADHTGTCIKISIMNVMPQDDALTYIDPKIFRMEEWLKIQDNIIMGGA